LAVALLHIEVRGACVQWPRRLVSRAVDLLETAMAADDYAALRAAHDAVAASLRDEDADLAGVTDRIMGVVTRALDGARRDDGE
jgi:hypothetical protein